MASENTGDGSPPMPKDPVDGRAILNAMATFRPQPSDRFHHKIAEMPWRRAVRTPRDRQERGATRHFFQTRSRAALAFSVLSLVVLLLYLATPGGWAAAQRFARFFERTESDRTPLQVTLGPAGQPPQFNLSLAEAEKLAGFTVGTPAALPREFALLGAAFEPKTATVTLNYQAAFSEQILRLSQRRLGPGTDVALVGLTAEVEHVAVGKSTGEYVSGAWRLPDLKGSLDETLIVALEADWDPAAHIQLLRWQNEDFLFEILLVGSSEGGLGGLDKAALIAVAESIP